MPVLYRKYRPKNFAEVVGESHVVKSLRNAVAQGRVGHAYLFCGGRGVGKTSIARILARAVNCLNPKEGDVCLSCDICKQFENNTFLDLIEVDAASNTGVDNVRELIDHIRFQPSTGRFKVCIIDEVHMLSKGAFNALLKTLEEPPAHVLFILATTEITKVPATIISRTQRFDFRRHTERDIVAYLQHVAGAEGLDLDGQIVALIAKAAAGGMRDALSMLDKVASLGAKPTMSEVEAMLGVVSREQSLELLWIIVTGGPEKLPSFFEEVVSRGTDMHLFNRDFLEYLREVLVVAISGTAAPDGLGTNATLQDTAEVLRRVTVPDLFFITRLFLRAYKEFVVTLEPELPMLLASIEASMRFQERSGDPTIPVSVIPESLRAVSASEQRSNLYSSEKLIASPGLRNLIQRPINSKSDEDNKHLSDIRQSYGGVGSDALLAMTKTEDTSTSTENKVSSTKNHNTTAPLTSLEELLLLWPQICDRVRPVNGPLATLLRNAPLRSLEDGILKLGVKFLFHKERLESTKHQAIIMEAIQGITRAQVRVRGDIIKEEKGIPNQSVVLSDALKVFGGELVE